MFDVQNQPPPLENYNLFTGDSALREAVKREGADWAEGRLTTIGAELGTPETIALGFAANRTPPVLHAFDRFGHRIDEVEFHPAWHSLMTLAMKWGLHSSPWSDPKPGAHVARAAGCYMLGQIEAGVMCPLAMTYGSVPTLALNRAIATEWLPRVFAHYYDPRFRPAREKTSALIGMGMTENQGGSDLRTNSTKAERAEDSSYRLTGHKWFLSAPMCDAFLVLAQAPDGIACFLMPRWRPDGTRNAVHINRLKDKLGNKSNASSEVEFDRAYAQLVGEEGRGIQTIIEMANYTRLDCAIGSAALMRQALTQALHHARYRTAFQRKLIDHPLMTNVLADMVLEVEAAAALTFRLARAYDEDTEEAAIFRRVVTPAAKFWICKRAPMLTYEAMEVLGGSGYIEDSVMPRLYREAPVNSIWEGSGNVMCLDVLRAIERTPRAAKVLSAELQIGEGARVRPFLEHLSQRLNAPERHDEAQARALVRDLVLALQAVLLVKYAPAEIADAFCASRAGPEVGAVFGQLPRGLKARAIVERASPQ
jgi:putative acyl-CoA dehydrogenase